MKPLYKRLLFFYFITVSVTTASTCVLFISQFPNDVIIIAGIWWVVYAVMLALGFNYIIGKSKLDPPSGLV
jgi:hypothetical protein